jgi:hypothetical protein
VNLDLGSQQAVPTRPKRRHLLIAGTGRAGTSFLVRFLTELGLETHISRFGENPWDQAAQAGLEDLPVAAALENLPHVFKSPWAYQFIEQMLADPAIELEGVIIPMREFGGVRRQPLDRRTASDPSAGALDDSHPPQLGGLGCHQWRRGVFA